MCIDHPKSPQLPGLRVLWQEAFGDSDAFLDCFFGTAFSPDRCLCIVTENTVAAAAYWFDCEIRGRKAAYIYAVATAKSHRRQGLCHALMDAIHSRLAANGYCGSIIVPGDEGLRTLYGAMGYENFGGIREFSCEAADPAVFLRKIDAETYAKLRRQQLPHGSVLQEGANLAFLGCWTDFYAGEDFLLAASREGSTLRGLELLGRTAAAPGIVKALDAQQGIFRTPGQDPFAMYRPLNDGPKPTYFAFAFD